MSVETCTDYTINSLAAKLGISQPTLRSAQLKYHVLDAYPSIGNYFRLTDRDVDELRLAATVTREYGTPFYNAIRQVREGYIPPSERQMALCLS